MNTEYMYTKKLCIAKVTLNRIYAAYLCKYELRLPPPPPHFLEVGN
jgi:hypothetical protein